MSTLSNASHLRFALRNGLLLTLFVLMFDERAVSASLFQGDFTYFSYSTTEFVCLIVGAVVGMYLIAWPFHRYNLEREPKNVVA